MQRFTPHSLSRRVRDLFKGDLGAHRVLPVDTDDEPETREPATTPAPRGVDREQDWRAAWTRRHADLLDLTGVNDRFDEVDRQANELNRLTVALLDERGDQESV